MPNTSRGLNLAILAAVISGVSIFVNKFAVASLGSPIILPTIKNSLVGLLFVGLLIASKKWKKIRLLNRRQSLLLLAIGIIGGAVPFYLFFTGLSQIPAINANIIQKSLILWVTILAIPLLKERISKTQGFAVLLLFAGNLMIGGFKGLEFSKGELMVLCATLFWAAETIFVKKILNSVDSDIVAAARMGLGSLILITASAISAPSDLSNIGSLTPVQGFWVAITSITLFGYVNCWYKALKYAPAISVSATLVSATLVTNILSAVFITHTWNAVLIYQGILIGLGALLINLSLRKSRTNLSTN